MDDQTKEAERKDISSLVAWYIRASYAYYVLDEPILSDGRYDEIAKTLLSKWDVIEHRHKHFITEDDLKAGTLMLSEEQYPLVYRGGRGPEFCPPERLRYDAALYPYHVDESGKASSWNEIRGEKQ